MPDNPQIHYYDGRYGGFTAIELTLNQLTARCYLADNMEQPDAPSSVVATFITENGRAGVQIG